MHIDAANVWHDSTLRLDVGARPVDFREDRDFRGGTELMVVNTLKEV